MSVQFDETLLRDFGLTEMPEDRKNKMLAKIAETVHNRVSLKMSQMLSESEKQQLDHLVDGGDEQGILTYLSQRFPNYPVMVQDEIEKLKGEMNQQSADVRHLVDEAKAQKEAQPLQQPINPAPVSPPVSELPPATPQSPQPVPPTPTPQPPAPQPQPPAPPVPPPAPSAPELPAPPIATVQPQADIYPTPAPSPPPPTEEPPKTQEQAPYIPGQQIQTNPMNPQAFPEMPDRFPHKALAPQQATPNQEAPRPAPTIQPIHQQAVGLPPVQETPQAAQNQPLGMPQTNPDHDPNQQPPFTATTDV